MTEEEATFANRYAEATFKYLRWFGEVLIYTYRHEKEHRTSIESYVHDVMQGLTEIQRVYTGGKPLKWGCKDSEGVIAEMERCAKKLQAVSDEIKTKAGVDK